MRRSCKLKQLKCFGSSGKSLLFSKVQAKVDYGMKFFSKLIICFLKTREDGSTQNIINNSIRLVEHRREKGRCFFNYFIILLLLFILLICSLQYHIPITY